MFPKLGAIWRQQRFGDTHQFFNELLRLWAKGEFNSLRRTEQIRDDGKATSLHSLEEQRRARAFDYPAMNFRQFQVGIDFSVDGNEIFFASQEVEEGAKI